MKFSFKGILTRSGWMHNVAVETDSQGRLVSIKQEKSQDSHGWAIPGFQNAHSHAFQYAMAGLAENRSEHANADSFWSWREQMYRIALSVTPDEMQQIATSLYMEMVRHGYTSVAEFHYLHHDPDGKPYSNIAEMGERLLIAAGEAGINITLIPMFYQTGNFGKPAEHNQRRFISENVSKYIQLLEATENAVSKYPNASLGIGIHSLRAANEQSIIQIRKEIPRDLPFHIHVAEQKKEVSDCVDFYGKRPVEWLLDNVDLNEQFHLVHATHLSDHEVNGIAQSGAHVVLCPSTEGNLGDGIFRFHDFKAAGGKWSIGTDSHIGLSPFEELRWLDYGQRLTTHRRDTFITSQSGDAGLNAITMSWGSGKAAMGKPSEDFYTVGQPFEAVIMRDLPGGHTSHPDTSSLTSTLIYTADSADIIDTIVNGKLKGNQSNPGLPIRFRNS